MKWDRVRPSRFPSWFISAANCSCEPAIASATTTQASLPESTMIPLMRSRTETVVPTSTNIFDPPKRQAVRLTGSIVSSVRRPSFSRENRM